jgi:hypothetical protein
MKQSSGATDDTAPLDCFFITSSNHRAADAFGLTKIDLVYIRVTIVLRAYHTTPAVEG